MRNKEVGKVPNDKYSFLYNFGCHLEKYIFLFSLTPAELIGDVQSAANMSVPRRLFIPALQ
jgi:hypothetical protein